MVGSVGHYLEPSQRRLAAWRAALGRAGVGVVRPGGGAGPNGEGPQAGRVRPMAGDWRRWRRRERCRHKWSWLRLCLVDIALEGLCN